jgi:hypothetical protein
MPIKKAKRENHLFMTPLGMSMTGEGLWNGDLFGIFTGMANAVGVDVVGTAGANGTSVCTYSLAAGKTLLLMGVQASSNAKVELRIGLGPLATIVDYFPLYLTAAGQVFMNDERFPMTLIQNATAAPVDVHLYMPNAIEGLGAGTNNPATTFVSGAFWGYIF